MKTKVKTPKINQPKKKFSIFSIIITILLCVYSLSLIVLILWAFVSSFKDNLLDFEINPVWLPKEWVTTNYEVAWNQFSIDIETPTGFDTVTMPMMFLYGFIYALGCSFAATFVPCITGYMCAKFNYRFSKIIYLVVVIVMILPIFGNLPAEIKMVRTFDLDEHIWGVWIMKANFLGLYFIVFYNYFKSLPNAYNEAAKIDGAGNFRILFRVILPMAMPIFFTVMLINFITFWNDYQTPLIYLQTKPTIALAMYKIAMENIPGVALPPIKIAAAMLVLTPVLILFLVFHKKLLGNLTMGGIKG
ncbi:MAG: carbohydrate ABC transporter permease [Bacilli bacterium]|nr:carbohydrate ABC transporter permease [Bacilli bacterium]